ncbi:MAG: lipid IV(A) 3-deoxy-D-manno-octulosonic acid transferase [Gammaproteobacteria bacterium]
MRHFYTLVFYCLLPLVLLRLFWRGIKAPPYRLRWRERLGIYLSDCSQNVVWFHCVSVGESEAAFPLIRMLMSEHPELRILVTTTTPTGSARVKLVLGDGVEHVYLPYDLPFIIQRFLRHFRPKLAVFMEKEIWPNLYSACVRSNVPLFIINARLSEKSAPGYKKIPALIKPALDCVTRIAVQTEGDRLRFIDIGADAERVSVMGNLKFDVTVEEHVVASGRALKQRLFAERFVWVAASTHQGEEDLLLAVYRKLKESMPELLMMIVPRHPERFQEVRMLCEKQALEVVMRSEQRPLSPSTDVYLADSMGELKMLYAASDVAFIGGSLVPVGGHNLLEPALLGVPVIFGKAMFNFQEIADRILAEEGAVQCQSPQQIGEAIRRIKDDADFRNKMTAKAKIFVVRNQGVTRRIADMLYQVL